MADRGAASFFTQAGALLRKNLTYQKRNMRSNILLLSFPVLLCLLLTALQSIVNGIGNNKDSKSQSSNLCPGVNCPILALQEWPPLLKLPAPQYRAVKTSSIPFDDLPDESCKRTMSCPATILVTGNNQSFGNLLAAKMFPTSLTLNSSDDSLDYYVLGGYNLYGGDVFTTVQDQCSSNSTFGVGINSTDHELGCVRGLHLWRNSSDLINNELYMGFRNGNSEKKISEIIAAYDLLNSDKSGFNVSIWYNHTESSKYDTGKVKKVPIAINLVSNAYLKFLRGPGTNMLFGFVKDYPKDLIFNFRVDISSLLGQLFYILVILQLFPVVLSSLLYEKQHKLRMMMKMHGLGDGPYWLISYSYFLFISSIYMLCFVLFGSVIGLPFFLLNAYSIQFVFYFVYLNLQISLAFLWATLFSNVRTATVVAYLCIFTTVFFGNIVFTAVLQDQLLPRSWILGIEAFPFMSLYRGLYEFSQYASDGYAQGQAGMQWENLSDGENGMREVLVIMLVDWVVVMVVALYIDHVNSSGKSWLFFLQKSRNSGLQRQESGVHVQIDRPDVIREREKVDSLLLESNHRNHAIICNNLKKVYPGKDGNPTKLAVKGLSLAVPQGECFGMLGPNGAGKTSFISMMIGLTKPTSGTAFIKGLDLRTDMGRIHTRMGVCPQHDLLWDTLTGREHLLFYGRLKNLKGSALTQAVEESLKSVNLFLGGNADKVAGKYSGGMKRRLSVAISLIGNPKVVYMDEPSTGLDPASRYNLWNVVMQAKQDRAIILTTHSMEEAEALCDRIGIFVDGSLQCIGNPKELKTRYGGCYVLTLTTSPEHEENVANLVQRLSRNASKVYHLSGTQKFELPKQEVRIADVFKTIEKAKSRMPVYAWGVADTTLEDVFIKVAKQ